MHLSVYYPRYHSTDMGWDLTSMKSMTIASPPRANATIKINDPLWTVHFYPISRNRVESTSVNANKQYLFAISVSTSKNLSVLINKLAVCNIYGPHPISIGLY